MKALLRFLFCRRKTATGQKPLMNPSTQLPDDLTEEAQQSGVVSDGKEDSTQTPQQPTPESATTSAPQEPVAKTGSDSTSSNSSPVDASAPEPVPINTPEPAPTNNAPNPASENTPEPTPANVPEPIAEVAPPVPAPSPEQKNAESSTESNVTVAPDMGKNPPRPITSPPKQQVFVLLGSHEKNNRAVLRVLETLGLEPVDITQHRKSSKAIEEFVREYAHICFAIVSLSADEFVYPKEGKHSEAKLRNKSELTFGLGFLVGRLGKARCFVIYTEQKSLLFPAPIFDVMYTVIEEHGFWQRILADRLQKAGYHLDEKILRKL